MKITLVSFHSHSKFLFSNHPNQTNWILQSKKGSKYKFSEKVPNLIFTSLSLNLWGVFILEISVTHSTIDFNKILLVNIIRIKIFVNHKKFYARCKTFFYSFIGGLPRHKLLL